MKMGCHAASTTTISQSDQHQQRQSYRRNSSSKSIRRTSSTVSFTSPSSMQQQQQHHLPRTSSSLSATATTTSQRQIRRTRNVLLLQLVLSLLLILYIHTILSTNFVTTNIVIVGGEHQQKQLQRFGRPQKQNRKPISSSSLVNDTASIIRLSRYRKPFSLRIVSRRGRRNQRETNGDANKQFDSAFTTEAVIVPIPGAATEFTIIKTIQLLSKDKDDNLMVKWTVPKPNETITVDAGRSPTSTPSFITAIEHPCVRLQRVAQFMTISFFFDRHRNLDQKWIHEQIYPDLQGNVAFDIEEFIRKMKSERQLGWSYELSHPNFLPMHSFITTRMTTPTQTTAATVPPLLGVDRIFSSVNETRGWVDVVAGLTGSDSDITTINESTIQNIEMERDTVSRDRSKSVQKCKQFDADILEAIENEYALDYCLFGYTKGSRGIDVPPDPPTNQDGFKKRWKQCIILHPESELLGTTNPRSLEFSDWALQISRKNNLGFSHIPKTGGTTIEETTWLGEKQSQMGGHFGIGLFKYRQSAAQRELLSISQQQQEQGQQERKQSNIPTLFAMVRHPCDRFVSAHTFLFTKIAGFINMNGEFVKNKDGSFPASIPPTVEQWVKKMWDEDGPGWSVKQPCNHMSPLTSFLFYELDEWRDYVVDFDGNIVNDDNQLNPTIPSVDGWAFGVDRLFCMERFDDATSWIDKITHTNSTWPHKFKTSHGGCAALPDDVREMIEEEYVLDYCVFGYETGSPSSNSSNSISSEDKKARCISDEVEASGLSTQQFFVERLKFCMDKHKDVPTAKILRMNEEFHHWPADTFENFFF